jgi:hypothetical protein
METVADQILSDWIDKPIEDNLSPPKSRCLNLLGRVTSAFRSVLESREPFFGDFEAQKSKNVIAYVDAYFCCLIHLICPRKGVCEPSEVDQVEAVFTKRGSKHNYSGLQNRCRVFEHIKSFSVETFRSQ